MNLDKPNMPLSGALQPFCDVSGWLTPTFVMNMFGRLALPKRLLPLRTRSHTPNHALPPYTLTLYPNPLPLSFIAFKLKIKVFFPKNAEKSLKFASKMKLNAKGERESKGRELLVGCSMAWDVTEVWKVWS